MKTCSRCGECKAVTEFNRHCHHKDGRRSQCRSCESEVKREGRERDPIAARNKDRKQMRRWREANRARWNELVNNSRKRNRSAVNEQRRRSYIKRTYGLTVEEYEALVARGCAICGAVGGRMALDHCHETGQIRDALCLACNTALGNFQDNPERLRAAIAYLEKHNCVADPS